MSWTADNFPGADRFAGPPKDQPSSPVEFPEQRRQAEIDDLIYRAYVADEEERARFDAANVPDRFDGGPL